MIVFSNPGLIDLRAIRTFGLNAKENTSPIGFFGTGLKYAIAVLLRTGHKITLYRGLERYAFDVAATESRGKAFDLVTMTGGGVTLELPFTLELGKNWQVWQAYRELHSNVLDEGGNTEATHGFCPEEGQTMVIVEGEEIEKAHAERGSIFLSSVPMFSDANIEVHASPRQHGFYRGIRATDFSHPSLFTYNLKESAVLTEDRTLKDPFSINYQIARVMAQSNDRDYLMKVLVAPEESHENDMPHWTFEPSAEFLEVYSLLRKTRVTELTAFATNIYQSAKKSMPVPVAIDMTAIQQLQLKRALAFCKRSGWPVDDYPIIVVPHAPGGVLALAADGKIILTAECFDRGVKTVVHALYEEWMHLKMGLRDCTREMQNHLFRQVVTLQEQLLQEAL